MIASHIGELAALTTALCWTISALAFERAGRLSGSFATNVVRMVMALFILGLFLQLYRGNFWPSGANSYQWFWLSISGIVGFFLGDLFLFKAYTVIGSRITQVVMTMVPPISAVVAWFTMGEVLSVMSFFAMSLIVSGIALVFWRRGKEEKNRKVSLKGLLLALGGATGQAVGLVISKIGMGSYDAVAATQIRTISGLAFFLTATLLLRKGPAIRKTVRNSESLFFIFLGSLFGPVIGVSLSLYAVQHTHTGIASSIMALVPIFIIIPSVLLFKQPVTKSEWAGAIISVIGVSIFFN